MLDSMDEGVSKTEKISLLLSLSRQQDLKRIRGQARFDLCREKCLEQEML